ncbi:unnamed protein product [Cuscuta campestris]|uniref:DM2 domain-containing protein n=1 Tax=Cuscuta campestris TaxID=132261 RepID=A0A484N4L0_9ASTE|nr:unnamed protein product [Cuscuta campestris]
MASDQEIAKGVETVLRQTDPNAVISLNGVVQQLEAQLGMDLSHKAAFISDQIHLLRSKTPPAAAQPQQNPMHSMYPFALRNHHHQFQTTQPQQHFYSHFALQQQQQHYQHNTTPPLLPQQILQVTMQQPVPPAQPPRPAVVRVTAAQNVVQNASPAPKESTTTTTTTTTAGTKRRGGAGGLNKVCAVTPELEVIVGQPALPRTEIVKQLWAYIRNHNLQDPGNKRKIICDEALRLVFETDCTDMFKMNKLLSKHILPLDPTKICAEQPGQVKRLKVETNLEPNNSESSSHSVMISDALANFLGSSEREMLPSEALQRVLEYIKVNDQVHADVALTVMTCCILASTTSAKLLCSEQ